MTTLTGLSDEVLDQVLSSSSLSVATLWCAGDLNLNNRIARCCRSVRTDSNLTSYTLQKWPRMLSTLRSLEVLVLDVYRILEGVTALKSKLKSLSPTIKHLELRFVTASMLPLEIKLPSTLFDPYTRQASQPTLPPVQCCWDLKIYFPSLSSASFVEKHNHKYCYCLKFPTASLSIFPPTLVTLNWTMELISPSSLRELPRGLTWLDFGPLRNEFVSDGLLALPPNLTHLNGLALYSLDDIASLPQSLVSGCFIRAEYERNREFPITSSLLKVLPPNMESLRGCVVIAEEILNAHTDGSWAALLPKNLRELELCSPTLTPIEIAQLPRSLTSLVDVTLDYAALKKEFKRIGPEAHQIWPPNLQAISLVSGWYSCIRSSQLGVFPPTLTTIRAMAVESVQTLLEIASAVLPPNLTSLSVFRLSSKCEQCSDISTPLPTSWTNLKLGGASLTIPTVRLLPRGLKVLHLSGMRVPKDLCDPFIAALPPGLEELTLEHLHEAGHYKLPKSITSLQFMAAIGFDPFVKHGGLPAGVFRLMDFGSETLYTPQGAEFCDTQYYVHG